jgi:hypothetical protein
LTGTTGATLLAFQTNFVPTLVQVKAPDFVAALVHFAPAVTAAETEPDVLTDSVNVAIANMEIRSADFVLLIISPFFSLFVFDLTRTSIELD